MQKKAIRVITSSAYNAHTSPLFIQYKILPLEKIIKQGMLLFMHAVIYEYAPKSFLNTWLKNNARNVDRVLRNNDDFIIPIPRIYLFKRTPYYALPHLWNNSGNLKFYDNKISFKRALREQLFEELVEMDN